MQLLIDAGNTFIKCAAFSGNQFHFIGKEDYKNKLPPDVLHRLISSSENFKSVWIASVAGNDFNAQLRAWLTREINAPIHFFSAQKLSTPFNIANRYEAYEKLGADRWAALIGAWSLCTSACCVIDCGTAVTVDVVDNNKHHQGGLIFPGLHMMRKALSDGTALCPYNEFSPKILNSLLATNTAMAIDQGSLHGLAGFIERIIANLKKQYGPLQFILTGGDSEIILPLLNERVTLAPHLVLEGLMQHAISAQNSTDIP